VRESTIIEQGSNHEDYRTYEEAVKAALREWLEEQLPGAAPQIFHNRRYEGKSGQEHQIDVSAEITLGGLKLIILAECKCYKRRVDVGHVAGFAYRLRDIGAHKAIIFTTVGFQEGAERVAEAEGIALVIQRGRDTRGWEVVIPAILLTMLLPERLSATGPASRKPAPDFTLLDAKGVNVKLSDYKGKIVLLHFWATWCGPCKIEIPWFIEFERTYKDRGFAVLGISMDEEGWKVVNPYIEQKRLNYRIAIGDDALAMRYGGIYALPTTLVIDRNGRIAAQHVGLKNKSTYEDDILQMLGS